MKTNKQNATQRVATIGIIALAAIMVFALIGCKGDDEPPPPQDLPKAQTATIHPFEDLQLTVKGTFTNAEWAGVAEKIETAIRGYFELLPPPVQAVAKAGYAECESIIVEKTTAYTKWKTIGDGETIYINFDIVGNNQALSNAINAAMYSMDQNKTGDPCNCPNETLHLVGETCCNSANCTCLFEHDSFHDVQVVSEKGVSASEVETIIGYLTAIYGDFFPEEEAKFVALTKILVNPGAGISKVGTVLNIGANETPLNINNYIFASVVN